MSLGCLEFRQIVGAEPGSRDPAVLEHRSQCRACAEFATAHAALDRRLETALRVSVPEDLPARVIFNQSGHWQRRIAPRWFALAASLLLAIAFGFLTVQRVTDDLPADVVAHIEHEQELLVPGVSFAEPVRVNAVMNRGGAALRRPLENVTHAGLCPFRGRLVPHLVVKVDGEPVSVLLLKDEHVSQATPIEDGTWHGVVLPHAEGSIAIVGARPELLQPLREQLERAVSWRT